MLNTSTGHDHDGSNSKAVVILDRAISEGMMQTFPFASTTVNSEDISWTLVAGKETVANHVIVTSKKRSILIFGNANMTSSGLMYLEIFSATSGSLAKVYVGNNTNTNGSVVAKVDLAIGT